MNYRVISAVVLLVHQISAICVQGSLPDETYCNYQELSLLDPFNTTTLGLTVASGVIPSGIFRNLTLISLNITGNITEIQAKAFEETQLETLTIHHTLIKQLPKSSLSGIQGLITLNLQDNLIENLQDGAFEDLDELKELILDNNKITKLSNGSFKGLKLLNLLHLQGNLIEEIDEGSLGVFEDLEKLEVSVKVGPKTSSKVIALGNVRKMFVHYI